MLIFKKFSSQNCSPCKAMEPVINQLKNEFANVNFEDCDVTNQSHLATMHGITSVPTMILYKNGVEVHRTSGVQSKQSLKALLERYA